MKTNYILTGRGNLNHWLKLHNIQSMTYEVITEYSVQTTTRMNEILMLDLAGGPKFIVGDTFDKHTIAKIELIDKKIFISFKK